MPCKLLSRTGALKASVYSTLRDHDFAFPPHCQAYLQRDACIRVEGLFRVPAKADALETAQATAFIIVHRPPDMSRVHMHLCNACCQLEIDRGEMPECLQRKEDAVGLP